ncbi:protein CREG1-like [Fagus crenata]
MSSKGFLLYFNVLYLVLIFVGFQGPVQGRLFSEKKPAPKDVAARARRLVSHNIWGVLRIAQVLIRMIEFGVKCQPPPLDFAPFGRGARPSSADTQRLLEKLRHRGKFRDVFVDDESSSSSRNVVSFSDGLPHKGSGIPYFYLTALDRTAQNAMKDERVKLVDKNSKEEAFAKSALFSKHEEMKYWPKIRNYQFFNLTIESIYFIDGTRGPKPLSLDQYLHPKK